VLDRGVEIVGGDTDGLAGLQPEGDLAQRLAEGVAAAGGEALGEVSDAFFADAGGAAKLLGDRARGRLAELGIALQAGDEAASGGVEFGPPAVIIVSEIKDISRSGLDLQRLGRGDVVDRRRSDAGAERNREVRVVDQVQLGRAMLADLRPAGPRAPPSVTRVASRMRTASRMWRLVLRAASPAIAANRSRNNCQGRAALASASVERAAREAPRW